VAVTPFFLGKSEYNSKINKKERKEKMRSRAQDLLVEVMWQDSIFAGKE
jgi:hypothetical protein